MVTYMFLINPHRRVAAMIASPKAGSERRAQNKVGFLQAHNDPVSACILCYDDSLIVTASHDDTAVLWDAGDGIRRKVFAGHADRITDCALDENHHRLLTASWDKSVAVWDIDGSATDTIWSVSEHSLLLSCDLSSEHRLAVAAADSGHFHVWDIRSRQKVKSIQGHANTVMCCRFDFGGMNLCTCSMDHHTIVWDMRMWKYLLKLRDHRNVVSCCAFSHNSHWLLTGSWDKNLHLYNVADGTFRANGPVVLAQHHGSVNSCSFSKDDLLLVSVGYDSNVNVWNNNTHQLQNTYKGHTSWIKDGRFGKDKRWIVTGDKNGEVRLWDTEAGNEDERKGPLPENKCSECGEVFDQITVSRPHNLKLNSGLCLLCQCRTYIDF